VFLREIKEFEEFEELAFARESFDRIASRECYTHEEALARAS
jgi:hypothetical protein